MTDSNVHRIDFGEIAGEEYAGQWAEIIKRRDWGTKLRLVDAASAAPSLYRTALLELCIARWSRPETPDAAAFHALDENLGDRLYEAIRDFYLRQGKERASRSKSVAGESPLDDGGEGGQGAA